MKILIVDDSAILRRALRGILEEIPGAEIRTALNGRDGLDMVIAWKPDVVTLDVNMPVMDGLTCLANIMSSAPCPVVMLSSLTEKNSHTTIEALSIGAVEVIEKMDSHASLTSPEKAKEIKSVVIAAAGAKLSLARPRKAQTESVPNVQTRAKASGSFHTNSKVVIIGVSTGGPGALETVLGSLPEDFSAPIIVAQHMPRAFTKSFAERLNGFARIRVVELTSNTPLESATVYIVRGGGDAVFGKSLNRTTIKPVLPDVNYTWHPSIDRLVDSALSVIPAKKLICVLLTGMGNDGAESMTTVSKRGGYTIAEDESSCVIFGMPRALIEQGGAKEVCHISEIGAKLFALVS